MVERRYRRASTRLDSANRCSRLAPCCRRDRMPSARFSTWPDRQWPGPVQLAESRRRRRSRESDRDPVRAERYGIVASRAARTAATGWRPRRSHHLWILSGDPAAWPGALREPLRARELQQLAMKAMPHGRSSSVRDRTAALLDSTACRSHHPCRRWRARTDLCTVRLF